MADKMTCPGCGDHRSSVLAAYSQGEPCPECGLSFAAMLEVVAARSRGADRALTAKYLDAVKRAEKAENRVAALEECLTDIRSTLRATVGDG